MVQLERLWHWQDITLELYCTCSVWSSTHSWHFSALQRSEVRYSFWIVGVFFFLPCPHSYTLFSNLQYFCISIITLNVGRHHLLESILKDTSEALIFHSALFGSFCALLSSQPDSSHHITPKVSTEVTNAWQKWKISSSRKLWQYCWKTAESKLLWVILINVLLCAPCDWFRNIHNLEEKYYKIKFQQLLLQLDGTIFFIVLLLYSTWPRLFQLYFKLKAIF